ncbi:MAG TPA: response regulator, partial [Pseudoxanthomonas sp.]|nr:response regulator [Pseudoxanthomonas sp.]
ALPAGTEAPADAVAAPGLPALRAPLPEPQAAPAAEAADGPMLDFTELDRDLVDIFVEEGGDLLDHVDRLLQELREDPSSRETIVGLQRDLHTLKGGARMAGIATIGDLGHVIESLLEGAAEHRTELQRDDVRLLERGFDTLHKLLVRTRAHRVTEMPQALIDEFEARIRGEAYVPAPAGSAEADYVSQLAAPAVEPAAAADAAEARATDAADVAPAAGPAPRAAEPAPVAAWIATAPLSAPVPLEPQPEEELLPRVQQEQVRVRADLLDNLVNHAGEVAIYRSRLEQQLGAFRGALAELDRTNARLRDQLRRLDLETEAQIVARYQREQDSADPTFDPLELDRFSTLQQLSRALNESAADLTGLQGVLDDLARQYDTLLQQQSRVSSELQDGLMSARMVPFDSVVPRLRRVVRQAAHDTRKQVQLRLDGTHGELDRNVLDRMVAPLEHMLRNSVAHGLELPKDRRDAGKPEEGTITIALRREGSEIVLQVSDDGRGLDRAAIRRRAEQRGLIKPDAVLTDAELDSVIFESGFSTSEQVSQLAGRGVGMDVVRNEVRQLGGTVEIDSVAGKGVVFTLRLPQTLAVTQAVFVQIGETTYAVPVASVSGIGRISRERFEAGVGGYRYAGEEYALHDLGLLVGQGPAKAEGQAQVPLLLVRAGDLRAAVAIDQVVGNREIVVKPVGLQISSIPGIYGATITGDGRVVVILDVAPLVRRHLAQPERPAAEAAPPQQRYVPLVMVVDDSLTMRKVTGRVLERHNFEVVTARDGVEALERLEERVPDLMLLDIEMPRMDGYELATAMRADDRFRGVPIVMITSRTGEKHRQRAFEIGVQRYLGKPYQELDLMRNVYDLLGIARVRE